MRKRFFRAAGLSIAVGLIIAFLFAVPLMEQIYTGETQRRLAAVLSMAEGYAEEDGDYTHIAARVGEWLKAGGLDMRFTVIASTGEVLADSEADAQSMQNHADRPEVSRALAEGTGTDIRRSETTGEREMYLASAVRRENGVVVYRASLPLEGYGRVQVMLWGCAAIGIFMGLIVALFSAHYSAGRVVEPLQRLTRAARQMAAGEAPVRVEDAPDEMGELAGAFNRMGERLTAAYSKLEQSNNQLAGVLQGMDDGVIAIDRTGAITLLTNRARELLGSYAGTARRLSDCGAYYLAIQEMLDEVMEKGGSKTGTLSLAAPAERILQVYAAKLNENAAGGALAVISDVTRLRKLEIMRSEFVANVTHELKTPLTSIRGYIELLKSGERDAETAQSFYELIEIEAERLQKLTDDLLQLSDIENGAAEPELTPVLIAETVRKVADTLRPEAESRRIALHTFVEEGLSVRANPRRLYQLIKNLMENAVKYNRDGGAVNLSAASERGVAVIRVHDTGIGIPPEHLDRIFERFYRVDKGRSRELGGTGLGLSIVKHIVNLYGGDVRVDSEVGSGTTLTVRLPLA